MQAAGLNLLVDPVMYTLDFGVPALIQGKKKASHVGRRAKLSPMSRSLRSVEHM